MQRFFWESTQRARREHRCDRCFDWIEVGDTYTRKVWRVDRGKRHVLREHDIPMCPPVEEEILQELEQVERAELGVPIFHTVEIEEVVVIVQQMNGEFTTANEQRTVVRTRVGPAELPVVKYDWVEACTNSDEPPF